MADFRMKLFTLAGVATVFAGMAYGQATCGNATSNAVFVRAEGNTEQVADTTFTCTVPAGNTAVTAGQTISLTVYLSPSVNITSANIGTSGSPLSEATAGWNATPTTYGAIAAAPMLKPTVPGSVSGNSVTFSNITLPGILVGASQTLTITNIKIAASTVAVGSGVPTGVSETIFVSGTGVTPNAITTGSAVAYVQNGLSGIKVDTLGGLNSDKPYSLPLCNSVSAFGSGNAGSIFTVLFSENFPNAFKIQGSAAGNATLGSWYTNHTETGYGVTQNINNTATSGTRIKIVFNNIPSGVAAFYVDRVLTGSNLGTATLTATETGAFSAVAGSTANGAPGAADKDHAGDLRGALLTVSNGTATAVYEITAISTSPSQFFTNVYMTASSGAVPAPPASPITATVSFAPTAATSSVPNFVSGSSTATVNGSTFSACSTTLLFPFVTNQAGFESGLAISNTGADLLKSATSSSVTGQSGYCTLTFFGNATASSNPPAFTTTSPVVPGTTWTGTLTSVVGGTAGNFGGYMIANCNFLFAHGFTYITYNIGQSSGMAMGYLALNLGTGRATPTTGAPESLGN